MVSSLSAQHIARRYGQNVVLNDISFTLQRGEVHGLVGHNGAGKSTFLRILAGAGQPDAGELLLDGQPVTLSSPTVALSKGIAAVYQELSLIENLTVAENMFLGAEMTSIGRLRRAAMEREASNLLREYSIAADPNQRLGDLPVAQRQMIEVVTAVHRNARYLLLDEPTTALEARQIEQLLALVQRLVREQNLGVLLIDHKLGEIFAVADRVTALADGQVVFDAPINEIQQEDVIGAIVGTTPDNGKHVASGITASARPLVVDKSKRSTNRSISEGPETLIVEHLSGKTLRDVSLTARAGSVLGIYGLVGSGRTRFLRCLAGLEQFTAERVELLGKPYQPANPGLAIRSRVGYLSEERKRDGFVPQMNAIINASLPVLNRFSNFGILRRGQLQETVTNVLQQLNIHGSLEAPITSLSGGNQQKAIFGRLMLENPLLMLLDEPTKGVDIGAKREIYQIVRSLVAERNLAVIVVSSEEEEILDLCDEAVIFHRGQCDGTVYKIDELDVARLRELVWTDPVTA
ncbi:MAG TPA: sugar ABC transporter ATP-binding protein [Ktedonobacteraceae bacterium]|nr:sugar ABC transporter ATP-binding protein [Ktedonobacteraceae bacterium]